jgi:regulator of protease activity HflC (stomatin/prohibitin superfamily)
MTFNTDNLSVYSADEFKVIQSAYRIEAKRRTAEKKANDADAKAKAKQAKAEAKAKAKAERDAILAKYPIGSSQVITWKGDEVIATIESVLNKMVSVKFAIGTEEKHHKVRFGSVLRPYAEAVAA